MAFAELYERFSRRTLAYLAGLLGEDSEDVQQEVWLAVYRAVRGLSNPRAFRTWLFQTTRHRAIDFLRRRKREKELLDDAPVETIAEELPDETGVESLEEPAVVAGMGALAPLHREALLLRYQDGMSYADIALVLGCPAGTVRSRLHHAKRRLQQLVEARR